MPNHDPIFKTLFRTFFPDVFRLFFPQLLGQLRLEAAVFLDKEHFTDLHEGLRREVDLLARVPTADGQGFRTVLIHQEIQEEEPREPMPQRMFKYALGLQLRHFPEPVLPFVFWFLPGKGGICSQQFDYRVGEAGLLLSYYQVGVRDLSAEEYLRRGVPLGYALAARMQRGRMRKVDLLLRCLRAIVRAPLDEARRFLLVDTVQTYLRLNTKEQAEMQAILEEDSEFADVKEPLRWSERVRQEGQVDSLVDSIQVVWKHRFGAPSPRIRERLGAVRDPDQLRAILTGLLDVKDPAAAEALIP